MSRWRCRGYRTLLVDYADGVLPMAQQQRVERHVAACAACADALAALQEMPALLRTSTVADPGEEFWREQRQAVARGIGKAPLPRRLWSPPRWEGWQPGLWRYPVGVAVGFVLGVLVYHFARPEQPPLFEATEEEVAALDHDSLVTMHDVMQALVPADEAPGAGGAEDEAVLVTAPTGDNVSNGADAGVPQAGDLSENELEGLDVLVGDFS